MDGNDTTAADASATDTTEHVEAPAIVEPEQVDSTDPDFTAPPALDDAGMTLHGEFPLNHRLRAEALANAGRETDPDGLVTPELIAAHAERLASIQAAKEALPVVNMGVTRDRLLEIAKEEGATFESDANKPALIDAINAKRDAA